VWLSARSAGPRRSDGCAAGESRGGARTAGRGSRPRSHRAGRSERVPQRRAATWSTRGTRRSASCNAPNRKSARSCCCGASPERRTQCSHRPAACRGSPPDVRRDARPRPSPGQALTVLAIDISSGRMSRPTPGPVVDRVAPQASGLGASPTGIKHRQRGVVSEYLGRGQHGAQHQLVQRRQPPAGTAHPGAQGGTIQCDTLAGKDLGLTIRCCAPDYDAETTPLS
jgi:hypothetical protein